MILKNIRQKHKSTAECAATKEFVCITRGVIVCNLVASPATYCTFITNVVKIKQNLGHSGPGNHDLRCSTRVEKE